MRKSRAVAVLSLLLLLTAAALAGGDEGSLPVRAGERNSEFALLVIYVSLALILSFLCSVAEAVFLSITPSYIEGLKARRPDRAALLKRLKQEKVDQALAAILTLNTIAHTVGAIGAGAQVTVIFGDAWFGLFSAVITLMILFLSEIVPKTIGAVYWSRLAGPTAFFVQGLIIILYPVVWLSERVTRLIARGQDLHVFSREEFLAMARVGENTGHLQKKESRIIRNLFRFDSLKITDIMTPRTVISALPEEMPIAGAMQLLTRTPFSRLPLYRKGLDDISGFILKNDALIYNARGRGEEKLKSLRRDIRAVPESISLSNLLEDLLQERRHIALVVDEYGGTKGLVTLEDLFEALMGMEIMDETDNVEDMRDLARKQWAGRARELGIASQAVRRGGEDI